MIAPVKPYRNFGFEQDVGDTDPVTSEDIDDCTYACPFAREVNNMRLLEHVQEFGMNVIGKLGFLIGIVVENVQFPSKLAKGDKKRDIRKVHSKCIQGASDARSGCHLSGMRREITILRWKFGFMEEEMLGGGRGAKPVPQLFRNAVQCLFELLPRFCGVVG
jgi:hypothetical protein